MRRAAALTVMSALTLTGLASAAAQGATSSRAQTGQHITGYLPGVGQVKLVRYAGYTAEVPNSWPVFRLGAGSTQCVRFDLHAVYLGQPGVNQLCPAHLVGRVATLSLSPASAAPWSGANLAAGPAAGVSGTVLAPRGLAVTATYGGDAPLVRRVMATVRWAGGASAGPLTANPPAAFPPAAAAAGGGPAQGTLAKQPKYKGFDTCATPSPEVMSLWVHRFTKVAVYLGGPMAACPWGNLTPAWVQATTRMGWGLIPTYVGPQAPCTGFQVKIQRGHEEPQGRASARHAIRLARSLGMGRGTPIYDDMEAYDGANLKCRNQVLAFLDGWTRELHAKGYRSGVYASAGAAAEDLGLATTVYGHPVVKPDSLWFALWDDQPNLNGRPYVKDAWWKFGHRSKQYRGGHHRKVRGIWLEIDSDLVSGAVYRG